MPTFLCDHNLAEARHGTTVTASSEQVGAEATLVQPDTSGYYQRWRSASASVADCALLATFVEPVEISAAAIAGHNLSPLAHWRLRLATAPPPAPVLLAPTAAAAATNLPAGLPAGEPETGAGATWLTPTNPAQASQLDATAPPLPADLLTGPAEHRFLVRVRLVAPATVPGPVTLAILRAGGAVVASATVSPRRAWELPATDSPVWERWERVLELRCSSDDLAAGEVLTLRVSSTGYEIGPIALQLAQDDAETLYDSGPLRVVPASVVDALRPGDAQRVPRTLHHLLTTPKGTSLAGVSGVTHARIDLEDPAPPNPGTGAAPYLEAAHLFLGSGWTLYNGWDKGSRVEPRTAARAIEAGDGPEIYPAAPVYRHIRLRLEYASGADVARLQGLMVGGRLPLLLAPFEGRPGRPDPVAYWVKPVPDSEEELGGALAWDGAEVVGTELQFLEVIR